MTLAASAPSPRQAPAAADGMTDSLSVYLDLLRFLAAMAVFLLHAGFHRFSGGLPGLWRFSVFGNDAVMLFFALSGFVIAYVASQHNDDARSYFASRLSRLWSICIPALLLTAVVDSIGIRLAPQLYDFAWYQYDHPIARMVASGLFLNELWFWSVQPFSNTPYWSIGYEFWYYALFGAWLYLPRRWRLAGAAGVVLVMGPKIALLLPIWLAGVWAFRTPLARHLSPLAGLVLCAGTFAAYMVYRFSALPQLLDLATIRWLGAAVVARLGWSEHFLGNYLVGSLVALHFVGARSVLREVGQVRTWLSAPIRYLASFTFALYLFHNPLLQFFGALVTWLQAFEYQRAIVVLGPLVVVLLLGRWAERQKVPLKRWLLKRAAPRKATAPHS